MQQPEWNTPRHRPATMSDRAARPPLLQRHRLPKLSITVAEIQLSALRKAGIKGIILDLDNTIVSEDDRFLSPGGEEWVRQAIAQGFQCYLLSNGKRRNRVDYWQQRLAIPAHSPARKPRPNGFRRALAHMRLTPTQVVVVGDSRHTDGLGAWLVGCAWIQVASLPHPPRWWEKLLGKWLHSVYPSSHELISFEQRH